MERMPIKKWWFALSLPVGLTVAFFIMTVRLLQVHFSDQGMGELFQTVFFFAVVGVLTFPLGLFAPFVWNAEVLHTKGLELCVMGWVLYASLIIFGLIKPEKFLFWILCALIVLNIGGCNLQQVAEAFRGP